MTSLRLRAAALAIAASLLAGCATERSDGAPCPPGVAYPREFLARAAGELDRLPAGSAIERMLADYEVMRGQARAMRALASERRLRPTPPLRRKADAGCGLDHLDANPGVGRRHHRKVGNLAITVLQLEATPAAAPTLHGARRVTPTNEFGPSRRVLTVKS